MSYICEHMIGMAIVRAYTTDQVLWYCSLRSIPYCKINMLLSQLSVFLLNNKFNCHLILKTELLQYLVAIKKKRTHNFKDYDKEAFELMWKIVKDCPIQI